MKTVNSKENKLYEMRPEYDFSNARTNEYAAKYAEGTNIVLIESDLMEFLPEKESNKR
jgi:hypothetical protein